MIDTEAISKEAAIKAGELSGQMYKMLAGLDPALQSAIIADLLAMWIAGHHPGLREQVRTAHDTLVTDLIGINELIMFGKEMHPGWADLEKE